MDVQAQRTAVTGGFRPSFVFRAAQRAGPTEAGGAPRRGKRPAVAGERHELAGVRVVPTTSPLRGAPPASVGPDKDQGSVGRDDRGSKQSSLIPARRTLSPCPALPVGLMRSLRSLFALPFRYGPAAGVPFAVIEGSIYGKSKRMIERRVAPLSQLA